MVIPASRRWIQPVLESGRSWGAGRTDRSESKANVPRRGTHEAGGAQGESAAVWRDVIRIWNVAAQGDGTHAAQRWVEPRGRASRRSASPGPRPRIGCTDQGRRAPDAHLPRPARPLLAANLRGLPMMASRAALEASWHLARAAAKARRCDRWLSGALGRLAWSVNYAVPRAERSAPGWPCTGPPASSTSTRRGGTRPRLVGSSRQDLPARTSRHRPTATNRFDERQRKSRPTVGPKPGRCDSRVLATPLASVGAHLGKHLGLLVRES